MADNYYSYDFQNTIRDMSEVFQTVVAQNPITSQLLSVSNEPFTNTKLEWLDDTNAPKEWTLDGAYTAGSGTIPVASTDGISVGMIIGFTKTPTASTAAGSTLTAEVTAVTAGVSFDFTVYGGSVDENLASGDIAFLIDNPKAEGADAVKTQNSEPVAKYNFSQIMEETVFLSRTALNTGMYGINSIGRIGEIFNKQIEKRLQQLAYKIATTSILMPRVQRSGSSNGTMGGWLWFLENQGGLTQASGGTTITAALINQAVTKARIKGGMPTTLVANPLHAKNISALNNDKIQILRDDTTRGQYVADFVTDFGDRLSVAYSYQMPADRVALITPGDFVLRPMNGSAFTDKDTTLPTTDGVQRTLKGEYSLEVRNVATDHCIITGLTN